MVHLWIVQQHIIVQVQGLDVGSMEAKSVILSWHEVHLESEGSGIGLQLLE